MSLVRGVGERTTNVNEIAGEFSSYHPGSSVSLWTPILPLSPPANQKGVLCLALPSPALHLCRENEFEEGGWSEAGGKGAEHGRLQCFSLCACHGGNGLHISAWVYQNHLLHF